MIASEELLRNPARKAGIKIPKDLKNFEAQEFPHWRVFLNVQLCRPVKTWTSHWHNAQVIAKVPLKKIFVIKIHELLKMGLEI